MHHRHETAILLIAVNMAVPIYSCLSEFCLEILLNVLKLRSREFSAQKFYAMSTKWTMFLNQNEILNNFPFLFCSLWFFFAYILLSDNVAHK